MTNDDRQESGRRAVLASRRGDRINDDPHAVAEDAIADILHWLHDIDPIDCSAVLDRALANFRDEISGNNQEDN